MEKEAYSQVLSEFIITHVSESVSVFTYMVNLIVLHVVMENVWKKKAYSQV